MSDYHIVVAPLHTEDYKLAMEKLTDLHNAGYVIAQRNIVFKGEHPYAIYWIEPPEEKSNETTINVFGVADPDGLIDAARLRAAARKTASTASLLRRV